MFVFEENTSKGFTLIEVMISMLIALFVLAGMMALFVSQSRTSQMLSQKTEVMNDLFLASQLMQLELRGAKAVCWDSASQTLGYQPLDSFVNISTACVLADDVVNGRFIFSASPVPRICWDRPNDGSGCQELIQNLTATSGISVVGSGLLDGVKEITLSGGYLNQDMYSQTSSLSFKVWPRNIQ